MYIITLCLKQEKEYMEFVSKRTFCTLIKINEISHAVHVTLHTPSSCHFHLKEGGKKSF